jgi:hypothetical protein
LAGVRREPAFQTTVADEPPTTLYAERLRDGRVALGTRSQTEHGEWEPGELHILEPSSYLDLAAWLAPAVHEAWIGTVRERSEQPLRTAEELFGEEGGSARRLALRMLEEIPPELLARGLILLANSIGPGSRARHVERLNTTDDPSEDAELRRRIADEHEALGYVVAAAALLDASAVEEA